MHIPAGESGAGGRLRPGTAIGRGPYVVVISGAVITANNPHGAVINDAGLQ